MSLSWSIVRAFSQESIVIFRIAHPRKTLQVLRIPQETSTACTTRSLDSTTVLAVTRSSTAKEDWGSTFKATWARSVSGVKVVQKVSAAKAITKLTWQSTWELPSPVLNVKKFFKANAVCKSIAPSVRNATSMPLETFTFSVTFWKLRRQKNSFVFCSLMIFSRAF